jgi:hypothetical protein
MFQTLNIDRETRGYYLNRTKASVNTAIDAVRLQTQQAGLVGPMEKVELELLDERAKSHDPDAVEAKIRQKFEAGGYGQFSRKFLDVYAPDLSDERARRSQLAIRSHCLRIPTMISRMGRQLGNGNTARDTFFVRVLMIGKATAITRILNIE